MQETGLIRDFSNIGLITQARRFPGFPAREVHFTEFVGVRSATRIELEAEDLISFSASGDAARATILAFEKDGRTGLTALGLAATDLLDLEAFESAPFIGWAERRGLSVEKLSTAVIKLSELTVLRADTPLTVWVLLPLSRQQLVEGAGTGDITLSVARPGRPKVRLPAPLGEVREEFTVSRGTARAYPLQNGEFVQIIDVEGQQCSDFMAFRTEGLDRAEEWMIDSTATRSLVRQAYPSPGLLDKFFGRDMMRN